MSSDLDVDRISTLPKNVVEVILSRLSIRDAVRTSILSCYWRYEWSTLPEIVFNKQSFPLFKNQTQSEFDQKIVKIVDQVLLLHRGPINKFKLSVDLESCVDIDRWILYVSRNGIKEFTLDIWKGQSYKLPSCLFQCEGITYLELYRCVFIPPASFKGFSRLTKLDLQQVTFAENGFMILLSLCPLLRKLVLRHIVGCTRLKICARELVDLSVGGAFEDLHFKSTPLLATASLNLLSTVDDLFGANETVCRIVKVLGHLPSIEKLELLDQTLKSLAVGDVPVCLPVMCPVKHLTIHINFEDMQDMLASFCIFRSAFVLRKLDIKAISDKNAARVSIADFWEAQEDFNCTFGHLKTMKVTEFTGVSSELKLIEFVLANSPVLEGMQIEFKENANDVLKIFRELIRFRRCSAKAEIFVPA